MGNRYGARGDEFDWNLGARRRLRRYLQAGLSQTEIGILLGVGRGAVAGAVDRYDLRMTLEQQKDHQARQAWERAKHGKRAREPREPIWDARLTETWAERKLRLQTKKTPT